MYRFFVFGVKYNINSLKWFVRCCYYFQFQMLRVLLIYTLMTYTSIAVTISKLTTEFRLIVFSQLYLSTTNIFNLCIILDKGESTIHKCFWKYSTLSFVKGVFRMWTVRHENVLSQTGATQSTSVLIFVHYFRVQVEPC